MSTPLPQPTPHHAAAVDCRHYRGDQACQHQRPCRGCEQYQPLGPRVCVIKATPVEEVIHTLGLLPELRRRLREAHVTWVTHDAGRQLLSDHPWVDRLLTLEPATWQLLSQEQFDLCLNLETTPYAAALATALFSKRRWGLGLSPQGTLMPLHDGAEKLLPWLLEEDTTAWGYDERIAKALDLQRRGDRPMLVVPESRRDALAMHLTTQGWRPDRPTLGWDMSAWAGRSTGRAIDAVRLPADQQAWWSLLIAGLDHVPQAQGFLLRGWSPAASPWDQTAQAVSATLAALGRSDLAPRVFVPPFQDDLRGCLAAVTACAMVAAAPGLTATIAHTLRKECIQLPPQLPTQAQALAGLTQTLRHKLSPLARPHGATTHEPLRRAA